MGKLFSFKGRTSRLGYWRAQLLCIIIAAVVWGLGLLVMPALPIVGGVLLLGMFPAALIGLAAAIRRLHDRGKGAAWILLFWLAPFMVEAAVQDLLSRETITPLYILPLALGGLGLSLWGLIEIGFRRGEAGANRFGDVPALSALTV